MGTTLNKANKLNEEPKKTTETKKKICCVCLETKKLRDECIVKFGEDQCQKFIEEHNQCLRNEGFDVK